MDRFGANKKAERLAYKILGSLIVFFVAMYFAGILSFSN